MHEVGTQPPLDLSPPATRSRAAASTPRARSGQLRGLCVTVLIVALLAAAGCAADARSPAAIKAGASPLPPGPPASPSGEAVAASASGAVRGDFEEEILLTGELKAVRARTVVAPETSIFQMRIQYLPDEGTEVKQGQPLVDFDNSALADRVQDLETRILDAETQIAAKQSELAGALMDLEIERTQKKYDSDKATVRAAVEPEVLSRKEYAERQFDKRKAGTELAEVEERIERTKGRGQAELDVLIIDKEKLERDLVSTRKDLEVLSVKAPQDGLVVYEYREGSQLKWKEGDNVWPGQTVVTLPDLSEMEVQFAVNEVDAPRLRVGMPVTITIDSLPDRPLTGRIVEIPSMAVTRDPESTVRIFRVRSTLSETVRGLMKPGMSVLGRVTVDRRSGALLVSRHDVLVEETGYRMVSGKDGDGASREIHPTGRNARYYLLEPEGKKDAKGESKPAPDGKSETPAPPAPEGAAAAPPAPGSAR